MLLGFDERTHFVYESNIEGLDGRGLWPSPILTPAAIWTANAGESLQRPSQIGLTVLENTALIFREDSFDPVTRIRRGRFYKQREKGRLSWHVYPHPALNFQALGDFGPSSQYRQSLNLSTGTSEIGPLLTFVSFSIWNAIESSRPQNLTLEFGTSKSPTFWRIIDIESIITSEELVTLKARSSFGAMPELSSDQILDVDARAKVVQTIETLTDTIHRAGPESVIDRARDAASAILLAALRQHEKGMKTMDLSDAIKKFEQHRTLQKHLIVSSAARIIARLHSRAKPVERERREHLPMINEQDAELAVLCVGTILRDLGWANWL